MVLMVQAVLRELTVQAEQAEQMVAQELAVKMEQQEQAV
jgi:hypothetical protein